MISVEGDCVFECLDHCFILLHPSKLVKAMKVVLFISPDDYFSLSVLEYSRRSSAPTTVSASHCLILHGHRIYHYTFYAPFNAVNAKREKKKNHPERMERRNGCFLH